jgi:hypothetical protein
MPIVRNSLSYIRIYRWHTLGFADGRYKDLPMANRYIYLGLLASPKSSLVIRSTSFIVDGNQIIISPLPLLAQA